MNGITKRVVCAKAETFMTLKEVICFNFLPAISGFKINNGIAIEFDIMLRPTRFGGTGIRDPVKTTATSYQTLFDASYILSNSMLKGCPLDINAHNIHSKKIAQQSKNLQEEKHQNDVNHLIDVVPEQLCDLKQQLSRITSHKCSAWLSANPWEDAYFAMTSEEFRDSLACRYGKTPRALQALCDGCGENFDTNHALACKNGGLVYQ